MPIDSNIPLSGKPGDFESPVNALAGVLQLKNAQQQNQVGAINLEKAQKDEAGDNLLEQLVKKNTDEKGNVDKDAVLSGLYQGGHPETALNVQQKWQQADEAKSKASVEQLQLAHERATSLGSLARGALSLGNETNPIVQQQGWQQVKQKALAIDPTLADHIPDSYDSGFLKSAIEQGRTEEESIQAALLDKKTAANAQFHADAADPQGLLKDIADAGKDPTGTKMNALKLKLATKYPYSDEALAFSKDSLKSPPATNASVSIGQGLTPTLSDDYGKRLALAGQPGGLTVAQFMASIPQRAPNRAKFIQDALNAADKYSNGTFSAAQAGIQVKQADNVLNQRLIASTNNVLGNIDGLVDLSNKAGRSVPLFNDLLSKTKINIGDQPFSNFKEGQQFVGEEIARVLGGGSSQGASDYKLRYGNDMVNGNLSVDQFASAMKIAKPLLKRQKETIYATMGKYAPRDDGSGNSADKPIDVKTEDEAMGYPPGTIVRLNGAKFKVPDASAAQ